MLRGVHRFILLPLIIELSCFKIKNSQGAIIILAFGLDASGLQKGLAETARPPVAGDASLAPAGFGGSQRLGQAQRCQRRCCAGSGAYPGGKGRLAVTATPRPMPRGFAAYEWGPRCCRPPVCRALGCQCRVPCSPGSLPPRLCTDPAARSNNR